MAANSDTIPCKQAYDMAGRRMFFNPERAFGKIPMTIGKNSDASIVVPSSNYGSSNAGGIETNQPVQFGYNGAQQQPSYRNASAFASNYNQNNPITMDASTLRAFQAFQAAQMNQNPDLDF